MKTLKIFLLLVIVFIILVWMGIFFANIQIHHTPYNFLLVLGCSIILIPSSLYKIKKSVKFWKFIITPDDILKIGYALFIIISTITNLWYWQDTKQAFNNIIQSFVR